MAKESELIRKRREVKAEILALKETIPSARIFNQLGKAFKHNSLGYWLSNVVLLNFILLGPWIIIGFVFGEIEKTIPVLVTGAATTEITALGFVVAHIAVQTILDDIANRIVAKINNADDLSKILLWLKKTWLAQNVSMFVLPLCLLWTALGVPSLSIPIHQFIGFGASLTITLVGLLGGLMFYAPLWASLLASSLKTYQYDMNTFSPADSEIISDISEMLTKGIYIMASYGAVLSLFFSSNLYVDKIKAFIFPVMIGGWAIIILQFLLTRSTLGTITNRAKWKILNRIQTKMNAMEVTGDLSDKDTAERLFRLADIHKQIMASKTNTFDLKSVSTLFSQLMLPLLGLLLGNLDKVLKLLSK
jgi:hypothetical protein